MDNLPLSFRYKRTLSPCGEETLVAVLGPDDSEQVTSVFLRDAKAVHKEMWAQQWVEEMDYTSYKKIFGQHNRVSSRAHFIPPKASRILFGTN